MHLGLFRYDSKLGIKQTELVQLMQKLMPWSHIGIICNKCTRFIALDPKLMFWCVSLCLGAFWIIFLVQETRCKTCRTGTINAKVHATNCLGIFATNAPDAPHWSPNSCFVAFRSVWVHLGPFHYCMKLGAKWAELVQLMQKFVPRSCIRIFRNEHTRSNP